MERSSFADGLQKAGSWVKDPIQSALAVVNVIGSFMCGAML